MDNLQELDSALLNQNKIFLFDEINSKTASDLVKQIRLIGLNTINCKETPPIEISINSPGGCVFDLFAIINSFKLVPNQIVTNNVGECSSAAALLLIAGNYRCMAKDSFIMLHPGRGGMGGETVENEARRLKALKQLNNLEQYILKTRTKLTPEEIKAVQINSEMWFNAKDALKKGLVDEIY